MDATGTTVENRMFAFKNVFCFLASLVTAAMVARQDGHLQKSLAGFVYMHRLQWQCMFMYFTSFISLYCL